MRRFLILALLTLAAACNDATESPADEAAECCIVTIRVSVPDESGTVYIAGNLPELGPWAPGQYAMEGSGDERTARLKVPEGTDFEYKFTLGSWDRQAVDENGMELPNFRTTVEENTEIRESIGHFREDPIVYIDDWRGSGVQGTLVYWTDVQSEFLEHTRHVSIWLPPAYDQDAVTRYRVLYMHDGKVLFDPRFGGGGGGDIWDVDDVIVRLVEAGEIEPPIVVAAWNSEDRLSEYSPWHGAPDYARFLIEELVPRVNAEFRTLTGPDNTYVMGSSMGGLLSYYLVTFHADTFGACGCVSSSFQVSEAVMSEWLPVPAQSGAPDRTPYIVRDIEAGLEAPAGVRYWFDHGTVGGNRGYDRPHRAVREWLLGQGLVEGEDFVVREYAGADHNEAAWNARLADPLRFLYGRREVTN